MSLPDSVTPPLEEWIVQQRWFASKAREIAGLNILERIELSDAPALALELIEARFQAGTHELYQLLPGQPGAVEVLGKLMGGEVAIDGVSFHGGVTPTGHMRPMGAEQSNSSVVFGDELVLKVFRRLEPGVNPELEMLRFLSAREFPNIAALAGWYEFSGELMHATLGILQEFVGEARDGWELAMDDPEGLLTRIGELGTATGEMHSVLASDSEDPAFAPEEPSNEALSLLTATIDEQIDRVFLDLPDDDPALAPIAGRAEEVRERLQLMSHVGVGGKLIRHHGDYHLGQTLLSDDRWIILDFEGEPARSLLERRRKRSPLRDVAGMLRSFAYAASASKLLRGVPAPEGWEEQARDAFLEAYLEAVDHVAAARGPPGDREAAADLRAREGGLRTALRAQQPPRLGIDSRSRHRPDAAERGHLMSVATDIDRLVGREHHDPHSLLGAHPSGDGGVVVRTLRPMAESVVVQPAGIELSMVHPSGLFEGVIEHATLPLHYEFEVAYPGGSTFTVEDPYRFAPTLTDLDEHLFREGRHEQLWTKMGAHVRELDGVVGTSFAVWAPAARAVAVVGDFNYWEGLLHPMRALGDSGIWELFIPGVVDGAHYKFEIRQQNGDLQAEGRPVRLRDRGPAADGLDRDPLDVRVDRRRVHGRAQARAAAGPPDVDLRGPPRLVAAEPARGQPLAVVRRARRRARGVRRRSRLHARRAHAGHGAPVLAGPGAIR